MEKKDNSSDKCVKFNTNVKLLLNKCIDIAKALQEKGVKDINMNTLIYATTFISFVNGNMLIEKFVDKHISKLSEGVDIWEKILLKEEEFFLSSIDSLINGLPLDMSKLFKTILTEKNEDGTDMLSEEDRIFIWNVFYGLVRISIGYIHLHEETKYSNGEYICVYKSFPDLKGTVVKFGLQKSLL